MRLRALGLLLLLPLMVGCHEVYQPLKGGIGFFEVPIGPDAFQISYIGDSNMSITEARRYAMLRAAELTALQNQTHFQIQSENIYISSGTRVWPASDMPYTETFHDRHGRTHAYLYHSYDPGYVEAYTIAQVVMLVNLTTDSAAPSIPAAYLLHQAVADGIKLSPGVAERMAALPAAPAAVTLPPEPVPMPKSGS